MIEENERTVEKALVEGVCERGGETVALRSCHCYRLYPTETQEAILLEQMELCRRLYNKALWKRKGIYERAEQRITYAEQCRWLPGLKRDPRPCDRLPRHPRGCAEARGPHLQGLLPAR